MDFSRRKLIKYLINIGVISSVGAYGYLKFSPISIQSRSRAKVVIVGLGSHGIAVANYLRRFVDNIDITAIDNNPNYRHRFSESLQLAKGLDNQLTQPKEQMLKLDYHAGSNFRWYDDNVSAIDPSTNRIQTERNGVINYDALILAPGVSNIESELSRATSARVGSFYYDHQTTNQTLSNIRQVLKADRTVNFYYPANTTASRAHFFENILLAYFLTTYYQSGQIQIISAEDSFHPVALFNQVLGEIFQDLNKVNSEKNTRIANLDLENNQIVYQSNLSNQRAIAENFDYLCFAPEAKVQDFVGEDLLMNSRFIPVNKNTLQHQRYANVFALGDAADLAVEKSLSSISEQVSVCAKNVIAYLDGNPLAESYDGYTVFSMMTSKEIGYYWERNNSGVVENNFYSIEVAKTPTRQQKIALTAYTQAKYKMALKGLIV